MPSRFSSFNHFYRYDGYSFNTVNLDSNILQQLGYTVEYTNRNNSSQTLIIKKNGQEVTELDIPAIYYINGKYYKITGICDWCFGGSKLTKVIIPDSVTWIGNYTFEISSLTDIVISNSVQTIYSHAFEYCTALTNLTIPMNVTRINDYAFQNCSSLILSVPNGTYIEHSDAYRGIKELKRY